ncbi:MAG: exo-alpha-sialidase [Bacteroidales bacterium]|nr:exo-alpha-sialidase [Bacteroidales bacterium]
MKTKRHLYHGLLGIVLLVLFAKVAGYAQETIKTEPFYLKALQNRLSEDETQMLRAIYAPTVVGVPPSDARADMCVMPDGEIRVYGARYRTPEQPKGIPVYIASTDGGLSWKQYFHKGVMGSATYFPEWGLWMKCAENAGNETGTFVLISKEGPDATTTNAVKVSRRKHECAFLPQRTADGKRVFFTAQQLDENQEKPAVYFYSDNKGKSFQQVVVHQPEQQRVVYPHKDVRWSVGNGTEPVVCEVEKGKMLMLLRNSTDCFYQSFSYDRGSSWTVPQPSPFQGTNTTPFLLRLSDGRIVAFWNNSRPLPEVDHKQQPNAKESVLKGTCEDYFTNRDVSHVTISDDGGRTWKGVRELYLNSIRNNADFRYLGTPLSSNDKSVHQFQAIELPYHKVLVAVGQNEASRRLLIFDVDWLYETERFEDFYEGLANVSTQVYLKSVVGHTDRNGHCAYNRTNGAVKVPDPTGSTWEVVQLSRINDPRLVSPIQGLVWNFPAAMQGEVETEIYLAEDAANISLSDCWYNPCDEYAPEFTLFSFHIDKNKMSLGQFHKVKFAFDLAARKADMYIDGHYVESCTLKHDFHIGLSYIIIQCQAAKESEGLYVKSLHKK